MKQSFLSSRFRTTTVLILCTVVLLFLVICGLPASSGTMKSMTAVEANNARPVEAAEPSSVVRTASATSANTMAAMFAPTVTAIKTASPASLVSPGGTITYTVTISASVMDALGVNFTDTIDANTTLVAGSLKATPVAVNETYSAIGNVRIQVPAASGVLVNDFTGFPAPATPISAFDATSANGGNVTMNTTDGSFTYNPPPGFEGTDTFTYTLTNTAGSNTGTVSITVSGMIWFIDNSQASNGNGRLTSPFNSLANFISGAADDPGDNIFLYRQVATDYSGVLTLLNNQRLIGQGATATLTAITGLTPPTFSDPFPATGGTRPNITSSGVAITTGSGNLIRGLDIGNTTTTDISGTSIGTLTLIEVAMTGTGQALNLTTGTLTATSSISITSTSGASGISLNAIGGALTTTGAVAISGSTGIGINIVNAPTGSVFTFGNTSVTTTGGTGIRLDNNVGNVVFADLDITPNAGQRGLHATNNVASSGSITNTSGTISTSNAAAIEINRTSGAIPVTMVFDSVSANGGSNGILLNNTSGSFTINGTGTTDGTGGTIQNITGRGASFNSASNITLKNMNFTNANTSDGGTCTDLSTGGCNAAIYLNTVNTVTLNNLNITGTTSQEGINGLTVSNFTLTNSTVTNCGAAVEEGCIKMRELTGTCSITGCDLAFPGQDVVEIVNTANSLTLNVDSSTFRDSQTSGNGGNGLQVRSQGTSNIVMNVTNSSFLRIRTNGVQATAINSASNDVDVTTSTFDTGTGTMIGLDLDADNTGNLKFNVQNNPKIYSRNGPAVNVFGDTNAVINGRINNNPDVKVLQNVGSNVGSGIRANINKDANARIEVKSNVVNVASDDAGIDLSGIGKTTANPGGATNTLDATVTGNNVTIGATSTYGIVILSATNAGDTNAVCVNVANNAITRNPSSIASFRARVPSANGFFRMQGFVTNPEATWNANGNTPTSSGGSEVSFGGSGTFASCTTALPTNPGPNLPLPGQAQENSTIEDESNIDSINTKKDILRVFEAKRLDSRQIQKLTPSELLWLVQGAVERWRQVGISEEDLARIQQMTFEVAELPAGELARAEGNVVKIDEKAAGYGWFVDLTYFEDNEFMVGVPGRELHTTDTSLAHGKMDLLSVVMRELGLGYLKGRTKVPKKLRPLMESTLAPSIRRVPNAATIGIIFPEATSDAGNGQHNEQGKFEGATASGAASTTNQSEVSKSPTQTAQHSTLAPQSGETVTVGPINTLPAGKSVTIMFDVTVAALGSLPVGTSQVCNQGSVSGSNFTTIQTDNVAGAPVNPTCTTLNVADLAVTKSDSPDPVIAGSNITYTVNFVNNGPAPASTVTVTDAVPANTTFVSATVTTGSGWGTAAPAVGGTGNIVFSKATVASGETAVFTIVVQVTGSTPHLTVINNSVTAASTTGDTTPANNTASTTTTVTGSADLMVTKTDSPDPVFAGSNITYTINFVNNGPGTAVNVSLTDAVPANSTFVSATVTTGSSWSTSAPSVGGTGNVVFTKASVPSGETAVFTIVVNIAGSVPGGTIITNTATATADTNDPTPANATSTTTTTVQAQADLAVTKTDTPDPVIAGNNITYTVNFINNGPGTAQTVTVTDAVPANTTFVSATVTTGTGWSTSAPAVGGTGNVVFSKAAVPSGETAVFTIVVKVNTSTANGATITNTATAASTTPDPTPANDSSTATTTVQAQADLAVTKSDSPDPVIAGANITYTINFTNNGPSDAQTVTVTDAVPTGATFVSATVTTGTGWSTSAPAVGGTGNVVFSKATVAAGETAVFTIVVNVASSTADGTVISNSVTAATTTTDPTSGNNTATTTTTVQARADLAVVKTDTPDPVAAGNNITYTVNFINAGPSDAQLVTVTDAVPANTTFVSATVTTGTGWSTSAPAVGATGNVIFSKATVLPGESAVFTIVVKVGAGTANGTVISNSATAASTTVDPVPANNTSTATTTVQAQADLAVTKTDTPDPVFAGANITYTVNFVNNGPSDAQTVTITDAVPANTTFVSATVTTGTGWSTTAPAVGGTGNITFSKATVLPGESAVFTIVVKVDGSTAVGTVISNTATAATTTTDPTPGNNSATATTTVQADADIAVTKTDSPDPVIAGNNITYTINFVNNGPSNATTVAVTDAVPANATFVSATVTTGTGWGVVDPGVGGTGNVVFSKATVTNGETAVFTIVVNVNANTANGATISNTVTATATSGDSVPANNTATTTTAVQTSANLAVTKSDSPDPVFAGANLTYTVNFSNAGPSDAQNVTVTDTVPANTTFVSATVTTGTGWSTGAPGVGGTGDVVFSKTTVAAGETAVFTIVVKVNSNTASGTTITNSAVAASTTTDPTPGNNTGTTTTSVLTSADLAVTKTDTPDPVFAGNNITYTVNFVNNGPSDAQTVTITDAVPANTTFVSATVTTGTGWSTTAPAVGGTGNITFSKATVLPGESAVFTIVVKVAATTPNGANISNTATAVSATTDPNSGNNSATALTNVQTNADLAVTKTDTPDPTFAGSNITYTVNFVNNGPSDAQTVTVTDAVPANTTFVSATVTTGTGWSTSAPAVGGTGNVVFSKATVAASETAVFTIVVKVNSNTASGTTITNSATAASTTSDSTPGNNTGTATTTVQVDADVAITKSDSPDPVFAGNNLTYTINLVNNGPSDATNVAVTDAVPANATFVSATVTTGSGWGTVNPAVGGVGNVVFSKATVAAGETAVFTIVVNVNANTANGATISNTATATATTGDSVPANNTATTTTAVQTNANLIVTKSDAPDPVNAGENITYTVNFSNAGPSDAQTVTVTDAVPANATFVSATVTTGTGWSTSAPAVGGTGNIVFSKGTVAAGETAVFTIVVKVNANTPNGTTITNSAVGASTTNDPTPANNTGTTTTTVQTRADLAVTKTDTPDPVFAGANITYTVNFVNNGPSDAQTVTVTDAVPANTTFVSATVTTGTGWTTTAPAVGGTGNVVFSKGTTVPTETAVFTIVVKVNSNTANGTNISNTATAASATTDPTPGNNSSTALTNVQVNADLAVVKTDSPDPVVASQNLTYTINFTNNGPSDAQTVTITDAVPANTTFVSATVTTGTGWSTTAPAVGGTGNVVFSKATTVAGETAVFTIVVKVDANAAHNSTITNTATVASPTPDSNPSNNSSTTTTTVIAQADLAVTKTDSPDPVCVGGNITYTLNFTNFGPGPGLSTTVTDGVPANTTFVSATVTTGTGWTTTAPAVGGTGNIVFSKASTAAKETATFTIVVNVNAGVVHGTVISNSAVAASTIPDPTPGNNTGTATTTVDPNPPTINCPGNITVSTDPNQCTAVVSYNVTATDTCPGSVTVVCTPPSGTTFAKGTTPVNCTATDVAGNTASCSFNVIVNDTQPPTITCPANITTTIPIGQSCIVVNYTTTASDNCPGVVVNCVPPSGTCFSLGTTTVTCTATDTSGNTATCSFTVTTFDVCLQDDSDPTIVLLFNSTTGNYVFCCSGTTYTGQGTVTKKGLTYTLTHNPPDRRLLAKVTVGGTGTATLQSPPGTLRCVITDRDLTNNTCSCGTPTN